MKYFEYGEKIRPCLGDGAHVGCLVPGEGFDPFAVHLAGQEGLHVQIFFSLYFAMTGLHALHMIIGIPIILGIAFLAGRGKYSRSTTPRWSSWGSTGTSWTSSGSSSFPLLYLIGAHWPVSSTSTTSFP